MGHLSGFATSSFPVKIYALNGLGASTGTASVFKYCGTRLDLIDLDDYAYDVELNPDGLTPTDLNDPLLLTSLFIENVESDPRLFRTSTKTGNGVTEVTLPAEA